MEDNMEIINRTAEEWAKELVLFVYVKINNKEDNIPIIFDEVAAKQIYNEKITDNTELLAIAKAGTYIRYIGDDLIKAKFGDEVVDLDKILSDGIARKIEEDTIEPASEEEVEQIINETNEIIDEIDSNSDDEPDQYDDSTMEKRYDGIADDNSREFVEAEVEATGDENEEEEYSL